jgi:hypothetical protein
LAAQQPYNLPEGSASARMGSHPPSLRFHAFSRRFAADRSVSLAQVDVLPLAAWYNYCWQTRKPGTKGEKRPTAAMMAGIAGHVWNFDELFEKVLAPATLN